MEHTAGAIRAAETICVFLGNRMSDIRCCTNEERVENEKHLASIIDRETNAKGLLEACKAWMAYHKEAISQCPDPQWRMSLRMKAVKLTKTEIAKAEGE